MPIRFLHLQPFTNCHFYFLYIVKRAKIGQQNRCARGLYWKIITFQRNKECSRYRPVVAQKVTAALKGVSGQQHAPAALYPRERPGTHFTGGWVGPRAGLDDGKFRPHRNSIPDRPAHSSVAMPTELPGPLQRNKWALFSVVLHSHLIFMT